MKTYGNMSIIAALPEGWPERGTSICLFDGTYVIVHPDRPVMHSEDGFNWAAVFDEENMA